MRAPTRSGVDALALRWAAAVLAAGTLATGVVVGCEGGAAGSAARWPDPAVDQPTEPAGPPSTASDDPAGHGTGTAEAAAERLRRYREHHEPDPLSTTTLVPVPPHRR